VRHGCWTALRPAESAEDLVLGTGFGCLDGILGAAGRNADRNSQNSRLTAKPRRYQRRVRFYLNGKSPTELPVTTPQSSACI